MSKHKRTVVQTYFLCDECGEECGHGMRTVEKNDGTELHACSAACQRSQDEKLMAEYLAARRAQGDGSSGNA